jgi:hypothetical protein
LKIVLSLLSSSAIFSAELISILHKLQLPKKERGWW